MQNPEKRQSEILKYAKLGGAHMRWAQKLANRRKTTPKTKPLWSSPASELKPAKTKNPYRMPNKKNCTSSKISKTANAKHLVNFQTAMRKLLLEGRDSLRTLPITTPRGPCQDIPVVHFVAKRFKNVFFDEWNILCCKKWFEPWLCCVERNETNIDL